MSEELKQLGKTQLVRGGVGGVVGLLLGHRWTETPLSPSLLLPEHYLTLLAAVSVLCCI